MSTKAYDFYRYTGKDIFQLQGWLKSFRSVYLDHTCKTLREFGGKVFIDDVRRLATLVDHDTLQGLRSPFNIDASVVVYLHPTNQTIYIQFFGVSEELYEKEVGTLLIDAHYQNQSDQPDNVSDEEWEKRREVVDTLIGDVTPSHAGFVFTFANRFDVYPICARAVHQDDKLKP